MKNLRICLALVFAVACLGPVSASISVPDDLSSIPPRSASVGMADSSSGGTPAPPNNQNSRVRLSINPFVDCDYSVSNGNPGSIPAAVDELLDCLEDEFLLPANAEYTFFQNGDNSASTPINFRVQYNDTFLGPQIIPGINVSESDPNLDIIEITVHEVLEPTRLYVSIPNFAEVPDATGDEVVVAFLSNSGPEHVVRVQTIAGTNMLPLIERDLIMAGYNVSLDTSGLTIEDMPEFDGNGNIIGYLPITRFRMEVLNPAMITTDIMFELRPLANPPGGGGGR